MNMFIRYSTKVNNKFISNILICLTCFFSSNLFAEIITNPAEHYAKGLYKESSVVRVLLDIDNDGLEDVMFKNLEEGGSNSRGLYYWALYLNKGNGYVRAKGDDIAMTGFDFYFINDLGVPGLLTHISAGGGKTSRVVYYVRRNDMVETKEIAMISTFPDDVEVPESNKALPEKKLPLSIKPSALIKDLIDPDVYSTLMSRDDNILEKYRVSDDPERPGTDWSIVVDKETLELVGYLNMYTEEFIPAPK